jgi:hypothetical protein
MARTISEEILTAYVLGELKEADRQKVAALIAKHDDIRRAVSKLEAAVKLTESAFQESQAAAFALTDAQRETVRDRAEEALGAQLFDQSSGLFGSAKTSEPASPFDLQAGIFAGVGQQESGDEGGDIFSSLPQETTAEEVPERETPPRLGLGAKGERHEDSVLFSLKNLQVLAQAAAPAETPAPRDEEGSGLIDIRALAKTAAIEPQRDTIDPALLGSVGFGPALSTPVVAPAEEKSRPWTKIALAASVVLAMGSTAMVVMLSMGEDEEKMAAQAQIAALEEQLKSQIAVAENGSNKEAIEELKRKLEQAKGGETPVASASSVRETDKLAMSSPRRKSSAKKRRGSSSASGGGKGGGIASETSGSELAAVSSDPPRKTNSELDDLLGGAVRKPNKPARKGAGGGGASGPGSSTAPKSSLSRADVQRGMAAVAPAVKRCGQGRGGTVTLSVKIGKTGRVSSASAIGAFAGTPVGSCAARAVRRAKFPASKQNLSVKYPFKL